MITRYLTCLFFVYADALCGVSCADVNFERDVLPILNEHCIGCHGPDSQESKLRLDSMVVALRGGNSGEPVIVPGNSQRSYLIERITSQDAKLRMPPEAASLQLKWSKYCEPGSIPSPSGRPLAMNYPTRRSITGPFSQ